MISHKIHKIKEERQTNTVCGILVWTDQLKQEWRGVTCKNCLRMKGREK